MNRSEARILAMNIIYQVFLYQKNNINIDVNKLLDEKCKDNNFVTSIVKETINKKAHLRVLFFYDSKSFGRPIPGKLKSPFRTAFLSASCASL